MLNPYVLLAVAVLWAISLFGVGKWQRADGRAAERVEWLKKDNDSLIAANATITRLNNEARAKERASADAMAALSAKLSTERAANESRRKADAAAIRAGDLRLRIPAAALCPGGSETGPPRPAPGGGDGAATVELPRQIAGDLLDLANDADQVADQLRACQSIIIADRKE